MEWALIYKISLFPSFSKRGKKNKTDTQDCMKDLKDNNNSLLCHCDGKGKKAIFPHLPLHQAHRSLEPFCS